jgi:hypothetical protein
LLSAMLPHSAGIVARDSLITACKTRLSRGMPRPGQAVKRLAAGSGPTPIEPEGELVERTFAWLRQFRRLRVRYDKRADIHEAFLSLENDAFGLVLGVQATVPAAITTALRNSLGRGPDGLAERVRFINGTAHPPVPNTAIIQVINDDRVTVPSAGHLRIEVPARELRLPEGTLPILRVGPTVTLLRNRENFQLICSGVVCP